ncbi:MAG: hypothetical protein Q9167_006821, partial [Letrouitia subvulpina]
ISRSQQAEIEEKEEKGTVKREDVLPEAESAAAAAAGEKNSIPESKTLAQGREIAIREANANAKQQQQAQENEDEDRDRPRDEAEEKARKVSEAAVRRYWQAEEEGRKAPRGTVLTFLSFFLTLTLTGYLFVF